MARLQPLFSWRSALAESDLCPATRHVALALSLYMNERGGSAHPGPTLLARDTGYHVSTVKEKLGELEHKGWLRCKSRGGLKGARKHANEYEATIPPVTQGDPSPQTTGTAGRPVATDDRSPSPQPPVAQGDPNSPENSPSTPTRPRSAKREPKRGYTKAERDPIFDALTDLFGEAKTKTSRGFYGAKVTELLDAGATRADVLTRGRRLLAKGWPDCTPAALVKHWTALGADTNGHRRGRPDFDALESTP